LTAKRTDRLNC